MGARLVVVAVRAFGLQSAPFYSEERCWTLRRRLMTRGNALLGAAVADILRSETTYPSHPASEGRRQDPAEDNMRVPPPGQARREWINKFLPGSPGFVQNNTMQIMRHAVYAGRLDVAERTYTILRDSTVNLEKYVMEDSAHSNLVAAKTTQVLAVLGLRRDLATLNDPAADHLIATVDHDITRIWLPLLQLSVDSSLHRVVRSLMDLEKIEDVVNLLTRLARGHTSNTSIERDKYEWMWEYVFKWHTYTIMSTPKAIFALLLYVNDLGVRLPPQLWARLLQYCLSFHPCPRSEIEGLFALADGTTVGRQSRWKALKLWWMLKQGSKVGLDDLAAAVAGQTSKMPTDLTSVNDAEALYEATIPASVNNALAWYEADRGNWKSGQQYVWSMYLNGQQINKDALHQIDALLHLPWLSQTSGSCKSGHDLISWLNIQRCLLDFERPLEDRIDKALQVFHSAQKTSLSPISILRLLSPIIRSLPERVRMPSPRLKAQVVVIYDNIPWPEPAQLLEWHIAGGATAVKWLLFHFAEIGDVEHLKMACLQVRMTGHVLSHLTVANLFPRTLQHGFDWEQATSLYEHIRLLNPSEEFPTCISEILHIPGRNGQHYPSPKLLDRLLPTGCTEKTKYFTLKVLLGRYLHFLRLNTLGHLEALPGHKAHIGAFARQLRPMITFRASQDTQADMCCALLLNIYFSTDQFDEGFAFWEELPDNIQAHDSVVSVLLDSCGRHARLDIAEGVWETYRSRQQPHPNTRGAWLECLSRVSKQSFLRARDILFFEMGTNGRDDGTPPADPGFTRIILSFANNYGALEETVEGIRTHLPAIWLQLESNSRLVLPSAALLRSMNTDRSEATQEVTTSQTHS
ncbi:hypothetical protein CALCODRAFT_327892 [Calocera cornea HHB12733]|uniref:Uncharacterized protein n=1 Tax=Calocera cornea HHB12733 TaxID=1353952 RepID=A0A165JHB2_9BASI|nr:hypothetical protein CALCODRAFT_327892 [Calocera cornea HHB12733]